MPRTLNKCIINFAVVVFPLETLASSGEPQSTLACQFQPACVEVTECTTNNPDECVVVEQCRGEAIRMEFDTPSTMPVESRAKSKVRWLREDGSTVFTHGETTQALENLKILTSGPLQPPINSWLVFARTDGKSSLEERRSGGLPSVLNYSGTCEVK